MYIMNCWICCKNLNDNDYIFLPHYDDEYLSTSLPLFKNTFIIKDVEPFKFLYYTCCNYCINKYLKIFNNKFKYLKNREIGIKLNK